jgi:hypothetical protein
MTVMLFFFGLLVGYNTKNAMEIELRFNPPQHYGWKHGQRGLKGEIPHEVG